MLAVTTKVVSAALATIQHKSYKNQLESIIAVLQSSKSDAALSSRQFWISRAICTHSDCQNMVNSVSISIFRAFQLLIRFIFNVMHLFQGHNTDGKYFINSNKMSFHFETSPKRVVLYIEKSKDGHVTPIDGVQIVDFACGNNHTVINFTNSISF